MSKRPALASVPTTSDTIAHILMCLAQIDGLQQSIRERLAQLSVAPPSAEPLTLTVEEAGQRLGIGRTRAFQLVGSGELPSIMVGSRRFVLPQDLNAYLSSRSA